MSLSPGCYLFKDAASRVLYVASPGASFEMWISQTDYSIMPYARKAVNNDIGTLYENCAAMMQIAIKLWHDGRRSTGPPVADAAAAASATGFPRRVRLRLHPQIFSTNLPGNHRGSLTSRRAHGSTQALTARFPLARRSSEACRDEALSRQATRHAYTSPPACIQA